MAKWLRLLCACGVVLMGLLMVGSWAGAAGGTVDLIGLTQETQKMSPKSDEMTLVWWIPEEYWQASLSQSPDMTATELEDFLKVLRPYTMLAVVDGTIGPFGGVTYKPEAQIRSNARLYDPYGNSYAPLAMDQINADTRNILQMIKPVLVNMLGSMGENMHFLLFPTKTDDGKTVADPKYTGQLKVKLGTNEFK